MRQYNEKIDTSIIEILYRNGESTFGKLKEDVQKSLNHTISFETYSIRLNVMIKPFTEKSRYVIQPVLQKRDEGIRGKPVYYSLHKKAKSRLDLKMSMLKSEELIEKAYRLLLQYIAFESDRFTTTTNNTELLGLSVKEFKSKIRSGLIYEDIILDFPKDKDEILQYFKLLESKKLINKVKSVYLETPEEEKYTIADVSLMHFLQQCLTLYYSSVINLTVIWEYIRKPTEKEVIWYTDFYGERRARTFFTNCQELRKKHKNKNQKSLNIENKRIKGGLLGMKRQFESIKNEFKNTIEKYEYFTEPLLNSIYPPFLRKDIETI